MDEGESLPFSNPTYLWRYLAHRTFDQLWHGKRRMMSRHEAYILGRQLLGWPSSQVLHIARLDLEQCRRLIGEVKAYRAAARGKRIRAKGQKFMNCEVIEEGFVFHSVRSVLQKNAKLEGEGRYWCKIVVDGKIYTAQCIIPVLLTREQTVEEILQE